MVPWIYESSDNLWSALWSTIPVMVDVSGCSHGCNVLSPLSALHTVHTPLMVHTDFLLVSFFSSIFWLFKSDMRDYSWYPIYIVTTNFTMYKNDYQNVFLRYCHLYFSKLLIWLGRSWLDPYLFAKNLLDIFWVFASLFLLQEEWSSLLVHIWWHLMFCVVCQESVW